MFPSTLCFRDYHYDLRALFIPPWIVFGFGIGYALCLWNGRFAVFVINIAKCTSAVSRGLPGSGLYFEKLIRIVTRGIYSSRLFGIFISRLWEDHSLD